MTLADAHEHVADARREARDLYDRAIFDAFLSRYPTMRLGDHARILNVQGVPKLRGTGRWTPSDVSRLIRRVAELEDEDAEDDFDI